jgi:hypothetical protein
LMLWKLPYFTVISCRPDDYEFFKLIFIIHKYVTKFDNLPSWRDAVQMINWRIQWRGFGFVNAEPLVSLPIHLVLNHSRPVSSFDSRYAWRYENSDNPPQLFPSHYIPLSSLGLFSIRTQNGN